MRRLREKTMLEAEITTSGDVTVEGQHIGHLHGFHFVPDPQADTAEAKTLRNAASKALAGEIEARADRFAEAPDTTLVLSNDGTIRWMGDPVARLEPGDKLFDPRVRILSDEHLTGPAREKVETRLRAWLKAYIVRLLGPLLRAGNVAGTDGPCPRHRASRSSRRWACSSARRCSTMSAASTRMPAAPCARPASASAPITFICRPC